MSDGAFVWFGILCVCVCFSTRFGDFFFKKELAISSYQMKSQASRNHGNRKELKIERTALSQKSFAASGEDAEDAELRIINRQNRVQKDSRARTCESMIQQAWTYSSSTNSE